MTSLLENDITYLSRAVKALSWSLVSYLTEIKLEFGLKVRPIILQIKSDLIEYYIANITYHMLLKARRR